MRSDYRTFWDRHSYAVVGDARKKNFPLLTYRGLKRLGKRVFAVDPSLDDVDGDRVYPDLRALPEPVDAVVLEVPKQDTLDRVADVAEAGIRDLWIHMRRETPEALALAKRVGIDVRHGNCAVMYLSRGFTYHTVHKWIAKAAGNF